MSKQILDVVAADFVVPFQDLAQPGDFRFVATRGGAVVGTLVLPVGTDTELRLFVHLVSADLDFNDPTAGADHGRVQRPVAVFLGLGDVIVELVGYVAPQVVDDPQQGITIVDGGNQHPDGTDIVDLGKTDALAAHLLPDAVDVLGTPVNLSLDGFPLQLLAQCAYQLVDINLPIAPLFRQQPGDTLVLQRFQIPECQILQLPFEMAYAETVGQRGIDIDNLAGDAQPLFPVPVLDVADRTGTFRQLDQRHPNIVDNGNQHLADLGGLIRGIVSEHFRAGVVAHTGDDSHLQHALDQRGHCRTETCFHFVESDQPLAHMAVQDRRHQPLVLHAQIGEDLRHLQTGEKGRHPMGVPDAGVPQLLLAEKSQLAGLSEHRKLLPGQPHFPGHADNPVINIHVRVVVDVVDIPDFNHVAYTFEGIITATAQRRSQVPLSASER